MAIKELAKEVCAVLRNQRRLKAATQSLSVWDLESAHEKLGNIIAQRRDEEDMRLEQERERVQRIEQFKNMLEQEGLSVEDLITPPSPKKSKKASALPPKYEVIDDDGQVIQWSGMGRYPKAIKNALANGKTLDDLAIKRT